MESEQPGLWPQEAGRGFNYLSVQAFLSAQSKQELLLWERESQSDEKEEFIWSLLYSVELKVLGPRIQITDAFNGTLIGNFQMYKLDLEKEEEPGIILPMSLGS